MFNRYLFDHKIPDSRRIVVTTPVLKTVSSKFRPIACTLVSLKVSKILNLSHFTSSLNVSDPHQSICLSFVSSIDALVTLTHFILLAVDSKSTEVRFCFPDQTELFNYGDRDKLLSFIYHSGIEPSPTSIPIIYFCSRERFTRHFGNSSSPIASAPGVSHGAIVFLFLFAAYVSSILNYNHKLLIKYADDLVLRLPHSCSASLSDYQEGITTFSEWYNEHNFSIDPRYTVSHERRKPLRLSDACT